LTARIAQPRLFEHAADPLAEVIAAETFGEVQIRHAVLANRSKRTDRGHSLR
jgi:hypothetical protein